MNRYASAIVLSLVLGLACQARADAPSSSEILRSFPKLASAVEAIKASKPSPKERSKRVEISEPGKLDSPGTLYVLTKDVTAPGTAFVIAASNVTLFLNGHKVIYGAQASGPSNGVLVDGYNRKDIQITGGSIIQAPGVENRSELAASTAVAVPKYVAGMDISHLSIEYSSPQTSGIQLGWGDGSIHHNILMDKGSAVLNRHQQVSAINTHRSANTQVTENAVLRTRQTGIAMAERNTRCASNVVYIDSQSTNSFGIMYYGEKKPVEIPWACLNNTVKGVGVHPIGIGVMSAAQNGLVEGNETETVCTRVSSEYGNKPIGAVGFRTTWGADKVVVRNNTFVVRGVKGSVNGYDAWGRAVMIALQPRNGLIFEHNTVKALGNDPSVKVAGIAVTGGNESGGLVFKGNDVESTWATVLLGDDYGGSGSYPMFIGNTFRKSGNGAGFKWLRDDFPNYASTGFFAANTLQGAGQDDYDLTWKSDETKELLFGKAFSFEAKDQAGRPAVGQQVAVAGADGKEVASGLTGPDGKLTLYVPTTAVGNRDPGGAALHDRKSRELGPFKASCAGATVTFAQAQAGPIALVQGGGKS